MLGAPKKSPGWRGAIGRSTYLLSGGQRLDNPAFAMRREDYLRGVPALEFVRSQSNYFWLIDYIPPGPAPSPWTPLDTHRA
jgi:hypothetical protein